MRATGRGANLSDQPQLLFHQNRAFRCNIPADFLNQIQNALYRTRYRGVGFLKNPFDLMLYMELIYRLSPGTIIEIGTYVGGSALWYADQMTAHQLTPNVVSIDRDPQVGFTDSRITFLKGDVFDLGATLSAERLAKLSRPWLVIEDSAHTEETCAAALAFFDTHLQSGDYIVIEDGHVADLPPDVYGRYENGPNRAVAAFLKERGGDYEVDVSLCDFFGENVTFCPNAWLRRR
jgi:cephalosporin hydroxylase